MNKEQKRIVDALINTFNNINNKSDKKKFNLIDVSALNAETKRIADRKEIERIERVTWEDALNKEVYRIAQLLREDLPKHVTVDISSRGDIQLYKGDCYDHYTDVCINRHLNYEHVKDEFGYYYEHVLGFSFGVYITGNHELRKPTIEELLKDERVLDIIRKRLKL